MTSIITVGYVGTNVMEKNCAKGRINLLVYLSLCTVTKPPGGTVFTQVVINHMNSRQEKLFSSSAPQLPSTIKNVILPPPSLMTGVTGVSVSSKNPAKASMVLQAPAASHPPGISSFAI